MQTPSRGTVQETLADLGPEPLPALIPSTESGSESESDDDETKEPVVGWHNDSYRKCIFILAKSELL